MADLTKDLRILILLAVLLSSGCDNRPVSVNSTNNPEIQIEKLFTHEGCTVYRFRDGSTHYFTDCRGSVSETHTCGKGCVRESEVPTND